MIHDGDTAHGESVSSDTARESRGFLAAGPGETTSRGFLGAGPGETTPGGGVIVTRRRRSSFCCLRTASSSACATARRDAKSWKMAGKSPPNCSARSASAEQTLFGDDASAAKRETPSTKFVGSVGNRGRSEAIADEWNYLRGKTRWALAGVAGRKTGTEDADSAVRLLISS